MSSANPPPLTTITAACAALKGARIWAISDGKAGDEVHVLGVSERLGLEAERRIIKPRAPFSWLMPYGPIDPREAPHRPQSPIAPPFPEIAIATGRRAVPYLRAIKQASDGKTFTVFLKDPRIGVKAADFLWVPEHDRLRGETVLTTLTSPHRITAEELTKLRQTPPAVLDRLPTPRIALLIGGNSKDVSFSEADCARLSASLRALPAHVALMATPSRRTPPALAESLLHDVMARGGFYWDGSGENPYRAILALADAIIVTADSVNMVGEAVATGKPVMVFRPSGGSRKIDHFLNGLERLGAIHPLTPDVPDVTYTPIDATPIIAIALANRYLAFRSRLEI